MKRIVKLCAVVLCATLFSINAVAQDLNQATEVYNAAATALQQDKTQEALDGFKSALKMAEVLGEEGISLAADCKNIIPKLLISLGKDAFNAKDLDKAIALIEEAEKCATEYQNAETAAEAKELIPQLIMTDANNLLNEGRFGEAIAEYQKVLAKDPENGVAYLRIGMAQSKLNQDEDAIASFESAAKLGQETNANKQLGALFAKKVVAAYKAKNNAVAVTNALKALEYGPNPQAAKIGGICAFNAKNNDVAIKLLEPLVTSDAKSNDIKYYLARAYEAKGVAAKACALFKQITADPKFKDFANSKVGQLCK